MHKYGALVLGFWSSLTVATTFTAPNSAKAWETILSRFKQVRLEANMDSLSEGDRKALHKIAEASELLHAAYLHQVWEGNAALQAKLASSRDPLAKYQRRFFNLFGGPWNGTDGAPVLTRIPQPEGAAFYPGDMKKPEFETWAAGLSASDKKKALGSFTVIRRDGKRLNAVPYHKAYAEWIAPAAKLLKEASETTSNASLKKFLRLRSQALLDDDYFESDVAWLELDSPLDVTIGPYETYDDKLFGYKASYESFVGVVDAADSKALASLAGELQFLENNLPIEDRYKNANLGKASPIRVINLVYSAGDARAGIMTAAFNLPNDEAVTTKHGSKKVMLKNVQRAKFDEILAPLAKLAVSKQEVRNLDFHAFFTHILAHELAHGLGPHEIKRDGKATTVRQELKEQYSGLEEAKADILGVFALEKLIEKGAVDARLNKTLRSTYLASAFRSMRFGIEEAHGKGTALQFNYLWDKGAIAFDKKTGLFSLVPDKFAPAVRDLTAEILMIQAEGAYDRAKALMGKYATVRPEMKKVLDRARNLPIDIEPRFTLLRSMDSDVAKDHK